MQLHKNVLKLNRTDTIKITRKTTKFIYSFFRLIILLSIGYIIIYPLFYMIVTSLISGDAYRNSTRVWIPTSFNIAQNYSIAAGTLDYFNSILKTFKTEIISAVMQIASCAVAAYGFGRFNFKGKKIFLAMFFISILVPDMMMLIPRMVNFSRLDFLGLLGLFNKLTGVDLRPDITNTSWTFWLPSLFGVGLRSGVLIFIYMQFFKGLPRELEEAAWVDGAGPIRTFLQIAIPSSGVVILTVSVFSLIWHWNDSLLSSMYMTKDYPLSVMLSQFGINILQKYQIEFNSNDPESASIAMAACVLFVTPMLVFYMIVQHWFIESIDRVGITG